MIIRYEFCEQGIHFFTDNALSQQLAFMQHPTGKLIEPHVHNAVLREVQFTQEVLFIRKGRLRVDFYDADQRYLESRILHPGDVITVPKTGLYKATYILQRISPVATMVSLAALVGGG